MSAYKRLQKSDVVTLPYTANKQYQVSDYLDYLYKGVKSIGPNFDIDTAEVYNGEYTKLIYDYVNTRYYYNFQGYTSSIAESLQTNNYTDLTTTVASASYTNTNYNVKTVNILSTYSPNTVYLITIPADRIGEGIQPGTIEFTTVTNQEVIIYDDGYGNLYDITFNGPVGNVFYGTGDLVFMFIDEYADLYERLTQEPTTLTFKNNHTIYEKVFKLTIKNNEFNSSYNPTLLQSGSVQDLQSIFVSSSFSPYICGIGLYNESQELLAVAKLGQPLPKSTTTDTNIIIKLDM